MVAVSIKLLFGGLSFPYLIAFFAVSFRNFQKIAVCHDNIRNDGDIMDRCEYTEALAGHD
jgi:hypothetical protein